MKVKTFIVVMAWLFLVVGTANAGNTAKTFYNSKIMSVRIMVWDDTEKTPIHDRAEIWLRGHGSWWLKRELKYGGTVKTFDNMQSGIKNNLFLYIDSRDGKEFIASFILTEDMNPKGSVRDSISISITDKEIIILGLPIEEATGEVEIKYLR